MTSHILPHKTFKKRILPNNIAKILPVKFLGHFSLLARYLSTRHLSNRDYIYLSNGVLMVKSSPSPNHHPSTPLLPHHPKQNPQPIHINVTKVSANSPSDKIRHMNDPYPPYCINKRCFTLFDACKPGGGLTVDGIEKCAKAKR